MLKVTYTETGFYLEYSPQPLSLLLSDRVCTYAHARRPITVQPIQASIPLPAKLVTQPMREQFQTLATLEMTWCDRNWLEVTLSGLWLTEDPEQEVGIFMTEFNPRLEQRLLRLWEWSQQSSLQEMMA